MKTKALIMLLLLLFCTMVFASEDPNDAAEHARKTQELNQLAERFKAETGFTGRINYGYERMRLGSFEGNFSDIPFTTEGDTIAFRQACERIVEKILPYSPANRSQLSKSRITKQWGGYTTDYYQQVGGYRVEGAGFIMITYEEGRKHFSVGDNTVDLPEGDVSVIITREDAIEIYGKIVDDELQRRYSNFVPDFSIKYYNINKRKQDLKPLYRLCWVGGLSRRLVIDVNTGEIYVNEASIINDLSVNVKGSAYPDHNLEESVYELTDTKVVATCDGNLEVVFYTDSMGNANISGEEIEDVKACLESSFVTVYDGSTENSAATQISKHLDDPLSPTIMFGRQDYVGNPSNQYYHANKFIDWASERMFAYPIVFPMIDVITGCHSTEGSRFFREQFIITINEISGDYSSCICHELTHMLVYTKLNNEFMNSVGTDQQNKFLYGGMDEAFSTYLPCSYLGNSVYQSIPQFSTNISDLITVQSICDDIYPSTSVTEDFYSNYFCKNPLASAWWALRGNQYFPADDQKNGVDTLLIAGLGIVRRDIEDNAAYRYKPRYFYNILMSRVDDGSAPFALNSKQIAIKEAYESRGFHFEPKVESYSVAGKSRNVYSPGDQVHAKITKAPQNTAFTVYVIRHDDYTFLDGAHVSTLAPYYATGFTPIAVDSTDADGKWDGLIWTIPTEAGNVDGGYDIIVDFGSPQAPDNQIHFTYTAANVRDGIDGLDEPGFKVKTPTSIDIVLALDCSPSMSDRSQLARTARQFVGQLEDSDRVGVFGFAAEVGDDSYLQDVVISRIPSGSLGLTPILNNKDYLCGDGVINFPSTYPYNSYWTDMRTPIEKGFLCFDELARPKHFVTLSDGWHCLPNGTIDPNTDEFHDPTNEIHNRISYSYVPYGIQCHTMRYKAYPTNNDGDYPYNEAQSNMLMNRIAEWGNGSSRSRKYVNETYQEINAILDTIRQSSSSIDENRSYTGPNPAQDTEILQFLVDKNAHSLVANFSINWPCTDTSGLIDFNLVSPSGIDVTLNPDYYRYYASLGRVELPFPEQGLWEAIVTRPQSTSSVSSFSFSAKIQSDLEVHFTDPPRKHRMNVPLPLTVKAFEYLEPVTDAQVKVFLRRDDWFMELSLLDDGYHNDEQANDGIYSNYMYAYSSILQQFPHNAAGVYDLIFELSSQSLSAKRIRKYRIQLEPPEDYPYASTERRLHSGWNWVGYPRLQRDDTGTLIDYANVSLLPHLTDIESADGHAEYRDNHWAYYGLESLNSVDGYKLRTNMNDDDTIRLYELGTIIDTLMVHQLQREEWTWLTYPCYEVAKPLEALADVEDKIDYIMAEQWSMKRDDSRNWISDGFIRPYLKYGDSIMVRATGACSFVWNSPLTIPDVSEPQKTSYFTYEDKPDYETLMIESIEGSEEYTEIGIFQDDTCIGARVIQAFPIQILAYSTPMDEGGGDISVMLYSDSKGLTNAILKLSGSKHQTIEPELHGFRSFIVQTDNQPILPVFALHSNYPNPFNPITNISFSVPSKGKVKLTVYNVKGQKVKELFNDNLDQGQHTIQWNGTDNRNRSVGSGIYLTCVEFEGKTKTMKMMLMK